MNNRNTSSMIMLGLIMALFGGCTTTRHESDLLVEYCINTDKISNNNIVYIEIEGGKYSPAYLVENTSNGKHVLYRWIGIALKKNDIPDLSHGFSGNMAYRKEQFKGIDVKYMIPKIWYLHDGHGGYYKGYYDSDSSVMFSWGHVRESDVDTYAYNILQLSENEPYPRVKQIGIPFELMDAVWKK